jgi:hypothetical protein
MNCEGVVRAVEAIYCHSDGYPDHQWPLLTEHYTDPAKVAELLKLGDMSILAEEIGEKHNFEAYPREHPEWCRVYGRDRGEDAKKVETSVFASLADLLECASERFGAEYIYLFADGKWRWCVPGTNEWFDTYTPEPEEQRDGLSSLNCQ